MVVDNVVDRPIVKQTYGIAAVLLDQVTKKSCGCYTRDIKVVVASPSTYFVSKEQNKRDKKGDENMDKVTTQMYLLVKHVMGSAPKVASAITSKGINAYDDEAKALSDEFSTNL